MTTHAQRIAQVEEQLDNSNYGCGYDAGPDGTTRLLMAALNEVQAERNRLEAENAALRLGLVRLANGYVKPGHEALFAHAVLHDGEPK